MRKYTLLFLVVLLALPATSEGRTKSKVKHTSKTEKSIHELIRSAEKMTEPSRKIAERAADLAIRETERQVDYLGKMASREAQEIAEMSARARADERTYEQRVSRGILKGESSKRKVLDEVIQKTDGLAAEAGRAAVRVIGASSEVIRRATEAAKEATPHLTREFDGALEDFRGYFGYVAAHPWKFERQKGWKMVDGMVDRTNNLTRGTAQAVIGSIRPLLAAMEGDVRSIHDQKSEAEKGIEQADMIAHSGEAGATSVPSPETEKSTPLLSQDEKPQEVKTPLPKFDIEHLNRKLVAPYFQEITSYRFSLQKGMKEALDEFGKKPPVRPPDAQDDPEPVLKVLK
jgi:hypothetical protein